VVQPALKKDCQGCHGEGQAMAKLDLRTREGLLEGGARGPAIVPGEASVSLLYQAIAGEGKLQMPPGGAAKRLPTATIAAVKEWIDAGAPWTSESSRKKWDYKAEDLWAFQPVKKPPAPAGAANAVDAFLNARMQAKGVKPLPEADRRTLIRRASIDLTGLPPAPEEVDSFVNDKRPGAYARLVERLLASPRYGERWGRHWLDVVRYADTSGYSNDFERPNAWRYRDYVIRSFNNDKPYDQFIREQIAGDEMDATNGEYRIATGFLRTGPWEHTAMSVEAVTRQMFLDDVTNSVGQTFLALTLGCARCHDHKFDPLPTNEYYRMQAVFATTEFARPKVPFLAAENTADIELGKANMQAIAGKTQAGFDRLKPRQNELSGEQFEEFKLYQKHMQLYRESLDRFEAKAFSVSSGPLDGFTDGGQNMRYPPLAKYTPPSVHVLPGGNVQSPAEKVEPGVIAVAGNAVEIPRGVAGRRLALAHWIADAKNPLTARVMVNRIWQYHFGKGIAGDSNNFGKMGAKPSHPELLDYLAATFVEQGWSVKAMHRLIMNSDAYRRASGAADELLAAFPPRRLEAEVIRDSILAVSGELSLESGGPGVFPQINEDVVRQPRHAMGSLQPAYHPSPLKRQRNRRTIYTFQQRSLIDPMVDVFNGPSLDLSCERRETSTVPTQAFALFNGQFVHDMALAMATRLERDAKSTQAQVDRAFQLTYGRAATPQEKQMALAHLARQTEYHKATPPPAKPAKQPIVHQITSELTGEKSTFVQLDDPAPYEENLAARDAAPSTRALADLALVLLNSNEFVYVY
ncbi:MAG: PSD1 domain-containing protein, partial [Bryobacterales bacterium]|nr:PSD1 domain-containing protein [Bryobacterales bacterium]